MRVILALLFGGGVRNACGGRPAQEIDWERSMPRSAARRPCPAMCTATASRAPICTSARRRDDQAGAGARRLGRDSSRRMAARW